MFIITILLSIFLSAGISYTLNVIAKNNNAMEKVRRYADKRLEDIKNYSDEQERKLTQSRADFEAYRLTSVAIIKRIAEDKEQLTELLENLKKDMDSVHTIESNIADYDSKLQNLAEMTVRVEDNLENLSNFSSEISKTVARISEQKNTLDAMEKRIPQISKDFSQINGEQLKAIGKQLLSEYDGRSKKLRDDLESIEQASLAAMDAFKVEISSVYESAAKKADDLEDKAFKHLSDIAGQRSDGYRKQLIKSQSEIEEKIKDVVNSLEKQVYDSSVVIDGKIKESQTHLQNQIAERVNSANAVMDSNIKDMQNKINEKMALVQKRYSTLIDQTGGKSDKTLFDLQAKIDDIEKKSKEKVDGLSKEFEYKVSGLHEKYEKQLSEIDLKNDTRLGDIN